MNSARPYRITITQIAAVVGSTLALLFVVAFVTRAMDAYRLRAWRDRLRVEIERAAARRLIVMAVSSRFGHTRLALLCGISPGRRRRCWIGGCGTVVEVVGGGGRVAAGGRAARILPESFVV